jgi:hypothetical protein
LVMGPTNVTRAEHDGDVEARRISAETACAPQNPKTPINDIK